jgi:hypothetical protein
MKCNLLDEKSEQNETKQTERFHERKNNIKLANMAKVSFVEIVEMNIYVIGFGVGVGVQEGNE